MAFNPADYIVPTAKPIPVLLLLDTSGSMKGANIDTLNSAVRQMLTAFSKEGTREVEVRVAMITFGGETATILQRFAPVSSIEFCPLSADGRTPLGDALKKAKDMIEDRNETPGRAYRPTVVLVSDGQPNDQWEEPLRAFVSEGRSANCDRMAVAIGNGANRNILNTFIEGTQNPLFEASQASEIHRFFKFVTMSVTTRMHSLNPHQVPDLRTAFPSSSPGRPPTSLPGGAPHPFSLIQPFSLGGLDTLTANTSAQPSSSDDEYF